MGNTFHQLDDLVLQLKGLVLVRKLLRARGSEAPTPRSSLCTERRSSGYATGWPS